MNFKSLVESAEAGIEEGSGATCKLCLVTGASPEGSSNSATFWANRGAVPAVPRSNLTAGIHRIVSVTVPPARAIGFGGAIKSILGAMEKDNSLELHLWPASL